MRDWKRYLQKTINKEPSPLMIEAIAYVEVRDDTRVLDLGSGAMNDVRYLLERGFKRIDVVDSEPEIAALAPDGVDVHITSYDEFPFPRNTYDFINAQYALPFAGEKLDTIMKSIRETIKSRGVFSGTFFGIEDGWATDRDVAVVTRGWVEKFFNPKDWEVFKIEEKKETGLTATGLQKDWHVFSVIAIRRIKAVV